MGNDSFTLLLIIVDPIHLIVDSRLLITLTLALGLWRFLGKSSIQGPVRKLFQEIQIVQQLEHCRTVCIIAVSSCKRFH